MSTTLEKSIVKARKGGSKWKEIAEEQEMTVGRVIFIHECATVPDDEVLDAEATDAKLGKAIVKMRDKESLSWGQISARLGRGAIGEGRARSLYAEAGGDGVENVKRGGRYPSDKTRADVRPDLDEAAEAKSKAKPKSAAKKSGAKKAAAKATKAKGGKTEIADMTPKEFMAHAKGKFVTTSEGDKFKVVSIKHSNGMFEADDDSDEEWGFELSDVKKVTAR